MWALLPTLFLFKGGKMCNPAAVGVISNVMTQVVEIGNQQIQAKEKYTTRSFDESFVFSIS